MVMVAKVGKAGGVMEIRRSAALEDASKGDACKCTQRSAGRL